jgi:hypothetical protein
VAFQFVSGPLPCQSTILIPNRYKDDKKLAGIIYLHEISQGRLYGTSRKNLAMFGKLCGTESADRVILATTKWSDVPDDVGLRRESQLARNYWKEMLTQGSRIDRFLNTRESAWNIVDRLLEKDAVDALLIQEELVDLQRMLPETEAGKALRSMLKELARKLKEEAATQENEGTIERLQETLRQVQELRIPLGRRLLNVFSFKKARAVSFIAK